MGLEKEPESVGISDYFVNPIKRQNFISKYAVEEPYSDEVINDSNLSKYLNEKAISEMIKVNAEVGKVLETFKIPIKINLRVLNNLIKNHLPQTRKIALGIANCLADEYKSCVNHKALSEATSLHDLAKVIIPENIINKEGALNEDEREIMQKHAMLSYEMLKTTDLDEKTLYLIKNHHHDHDENCVSDINLQILSIADVYSALREKRSYKPSMSRESSLQIINEQVRKGKFDPEIYEALVQYSKEENSRKFKFDWKIFNLKPVDSFSS